VYTGKTCYQKISTNTYRKWVFDPNGYCKKYPFNCSLRFFVAGIVVGSLS
jgi:hypothetical protein